MKKIKKKLRFIGFLPVLALSPALYGHLYEQAGALWRELVAQPVRLLTLMSLAVLFALIRLTSVEVYSYDTDEIPICLGRELLWPIRGRIRLPRRLFQKAQTARVCIKLSPLCYRMMRSRRICVCYRSAREEHKAAPILQLMLPV